jgi:hypothetical protein
MGSARTSKSKSKSKSMKRNELLLPLLLARVGPCWKSSAVIGRLAVLRGIAVQNP